MMHPDDFLTTLATDAATDATEAGRSGEGSVAASIEATNIDATQDATDEVHWTTTVTDLLREAAQIAGDNDSELDAFMRAAYGAYLEEHPDVRDQLAEAQLLADVAAMRRAGRVGRA